MSVLLFWTGYVAAVVLLARSPLFTRLEDAMTRPDPPAYVKKNRRAPSR